MTGEVIELVSRQGEARPSRRGLCAGLTHREQEVMSLIAQGWGNSAICDSLCIAPKTLERHISNLYRKLEVAESHDVHRRVAATLAWIEATSVPTALRLAL